MAFYIANPLQADPNVLKQRALDYLAAYAPPGFQLQSGDPLDLFYESGAQTAGEQADVVNGGLDGAFRYLGSLFNLPPVDATPSSAAVTITVQDTAGYTIPAGAIWGLKDATGTLQAFDLTANVVIAPGASTGTGTVISETAGTVVNGLSGIAQPVQNVPTFVTQASIALTVGAVDAELDSTYLDRLAETFTLLTPRPMLARDFGVLARSVPGVYRAAGVDNLKPGPPYDGAAEASGLEDNFTIAVADVNGLPVGSVVRGNVQTYLESFLNQNSVVWAVDPQYTNIDATVHAYAWPGWDTTAVQAAVIASLQTALSPAVFGTDPTGNAARWKNDPVVRLDRIMEAVTSVPGVRFVSPTPAFGLHGGSLSATDVPLGAGSLIPALPTAGTITVTITATT